MRDQRSRVTRISMEGRKKARDISRAFFHHVRGWQARMQRVPNPGELVFLNAFLALREL